MKKLIILASVIMVLNACKDNSETEKTVTTTETTTNSTVGPEGASSTVTRTVETDSTEIKVKAEEVDINEIDTTDSNRRKQ